MNAKRHESNAGLQPAARRPVRAARICSKPTFHSWPLRIANPRSEAAHPLRAGEKDQRVRCVHSASNRTSDFARFRLHDSRSLKHLRKTQAERSWPMPEDFEKAPIRNGLRDITAGEIGKHPLMVSCPPRLAAPIGRTSPRHPPSASCSRIRCETACRRVAFLHDRHRS